MWSTTRSHSWVIPFLIYINNLGRVSKYLIPIKFSYDTDLFCFLKDITILFENDNNELKRISQWFKANKFLLNENKTRFSLCHRLGVRDKKRFSLRTLKSINMN